MPQNNDLTYDHYNFNTSHTFLEPTVEKSDKSMWTSTNFQVTLQEISHQNQHLI